MGPQTPADKEADARREQEEEDRRTAQCTMWATSLSALIDYFELGDCDSFSLSRKKRSTCRELGEKIDDLAAKVANC